MRKTAFRLAGISIVASAWACAQGATLFMGAYPDSLLIFDEARGQVVGRIPLTTGLPTSMRLSADKKTIYVTTNNHSGIEVVDVATRKVVSHFAMDTPTKRYRFNGGAPDPAGKLFYTIMTEMDKLTDRYEIGKPKYTVVDIAQQKIVKSFDVAREDEAANSGGFFRGGFEISRDGKYLYQFRDKVVILDTADFKVVDRIDLSKPDDPAMENIGFGGLLDNLSEPGVHMSLFNSADPVVHNRVFGIARFDLDSRQVVYEPIGPAPAAMTGLQVTPDKKNAYTVVTNGTLGNKRCEFWHFDLATNKMVDKSEFACKSRFSFGMSSDGKKLYIYGASFDVQVYDAATFKLEKTWDLNNDITMAGLIIVE
jgi:DNA-binding beta-propeller fold protein YncE